MRNSCLFQALYNRRTFFLASSLLVDNIGLACLVATLAMLDAIFVYKLNFGWLVEHEAIAAPAATCCQSEKKKPFNSRRYQRK